MLKIEPKNEGGMMCRMINAPILMHFSTLHSRIKKLILLFGSSRGGGYICSSLLHILNTWFSCFYFQFFTW